MDLLSFHYHLTYHNCKHVYHKSFNEDSHSFNQAVYKNMELGTTVTIPLQYSNLDDEFVIFCCGWLNIPVPDELVL